MAPVSFRHLDTPGAHEDLELRIGGYRHTADSYYFGIADGPGVPATVGGRLAHVLDQWLRLINAVRPGAAAYLPFDLSDQCTAWLRVTPQEGGQVLVEAGWSDVEGWSVDPGDIAGAAAEPGDFDPIPEARITTTADDLRAAIRRDRDAFAALP